MNRFLGHTVVVAGGFRGIGRACVEAFEQEGATVFVLDRQGTPVVDITDEVAVDQFFAELDQTPSVFVNAAGDANLQSIIDQPVEEFRRIVNIELVGAYAGLRAAARRMIADGVHGSIVTISSVNGSLPSPGLSGHCSAKAGVDMLTRVAAVELGAAGIRVNAVAPGCTLTPLTAPFVALPSYAEGVRLSTPIEGRMGEPAEIASAVLFLASKDARWITGRTLAADGGQSLVFMPDPLAAAAEAGAAFESQVVPLPA